jgi:hypothetical protein
VVREEGFEKEAASGQLTPVASSPSAAGVAGAEPKSF